MYTILIVEDETMSALLLQNMINKLFHNVQIIGIAKNVAEATEMIHEQNPDIVCLDINLGLESGFEVMKKTNADEYELIVITAYEDYMLQAIKNSAIDYILKPYDYEDIKAAISKAIHRIDKKKSYNISKNDLKKIPLGTAEGITFVDMDDIIYIKADTSYSEFHLIDGKKILVSKRLSLFEEMLAAQHFYRVHKSYMVNLKYITKYQKGRYGSLIMSNNDEIPIGENKKQEIIKISEQQ